jgi:uncharacterized protein
MRRRDREPSVCWLHADVQVHNSTIQGRGLFATRPLSAGITIALLGGRLVTSKQLHQLLIEAAVHQYVDTICVDDDVHLILPPNQPIHYGNHSCDPTLWHTDAYTLVTRRAVDTGEELTVDYATQTTEPSFRMSCRCGTSVCRKVVTGTDWQVPVWADRYQGHVVPAVARLIQAQRRSDLPNREPFC